MRGRASHFQVSHRFGFWFCPSKDVIRFRDDYRANIYSEIIKYSSLLKRAMQRNEVFIKKLGLMEGDMSK